MTLPKIETHPRWLASRPVWLALVATLVFLVAYPRPGLFFRTIAHAIHPPIRPAEVAAISPNLPGDPAQVEQWVIEHIQRDANDYANWGVIFYVTTPAEVLGIGRGPCYGRAIVLASILEDKHIPYRLYMMPGHVWVDYQDRVPPIWPEFEKSEYAVWRWENGRWHYHGFGWLAILPRMVAIQAHLYWRILPVAGKVALLVTLMACIGMVWLSKRRA